MSRYDGFIFDIDGTLVSTNRLIFDTFNYVAEKYLNRKYSDEEIIGFFGPTEDVILKELMKENYEEARRDYYNYYRENHSKLVKVYDGIEDILKTIKAEGKPIGIFTGKGRESSIISLQESGLYKYFDLIVTGDDVKNHKPSAEGIIKFLEHFQIPPQKVLMIGDAVSDIKAAREAGVQVASVLWDSYAKEKVLKSNSDFYFHTVEELQAFIKNALQEP